MRHRTFAQRLELQRIWYRIGAHGARAAIAAGRPVKGPITAERALQLAYWLGAYQAVRRTPTAPQSYAVAA